ncbi:hypothetical protein MPER_10174 [Moniliophthora perniciosa FA553]|nr:hypothetical protein MPER_10174 [Moniliophthora perniciosa FA553]
MIEELSSFIHDVSVASVPGRYLANHLPVLEHVPEFMAKWKREMKTKYRSVVQKQDPEPSFCTMLVETHDQHGLNDLESAWLAASATTIEWLVIAMLAFPDVQRKVQAEIDVVIGQSRIPTLADMENLPYMRAVVKEVGIVVPPPNAFLTSSC